MSAVFVAMLVLGIGSRRDGHCASPGGGRREGNSGCASWSGWSEGQDVRCGGRYSTPRLTKSRLLALRCSPLLSSPPQPVAGSLSNGILDAGQSATSPERQRRDVPALALGACVRLPRGAYQTAVG